MSEADQATTALLKGDGYHVLEAVIDPDTAAVVRRYVLEHLDEGRENAPGDINLTDLLFRGRRFHDLVTHPRILGVARSLLGHDAKLGAYSAKVLFPGCSSGRLHVDYPYWAMDPGMPVEPALMMQVIWMMEPFGAQNAGTWVAPGSQKRSTAVDIDRFRSEAIQVEGDAGDAILSHGLLWHQTAVNHSDQPRVAILINYCQLSIRPMRELGPFSDEFLEDASEDLKMLLPLDHWASLMARLGRRG